MQTCDQCALEASLAHPLCQVLNAFIAEGPAGLVGAVFNQLVRYLLDLLAELRLSINHLVDRRLGAGLPAPPDPCTTVATHRCSSRKVRICSAARRYSCAIKDVGAKSASVIPCAGASAAATARRMGAKWSGTRSTPACC